MDFKIMKCPVCGSLLDAGPDEKYIIYRACDTPLRLNEDATSFRRHEHNNLPIGRSCRRFGRFVTMGDTYGEKYGSISAI